MGHDIDIVCFSIKNGKATKISVDAEIYLSYNWSDLSEICPVHFLEADGTCPKHSDCQKIHLWYFRDDCHARRSDDVAQRAQGALDVLSSYDITPGTPDPTNFNWGYGVYETNDGCEVLGIRKTKRLPPKQRVAVFAYHLKQFLEEANNYPDCFFIGDISYDSDLILPDGSTVPQAAHDDNDDRDNSEDTGEPHVQSGPITYFRHPFKGNFRVNSFKTAMEVYGIVSAQDSSMADAWYDLAMQMPDAPGK